MSKGYLKAGFKLSKGHIQGRFEITPSHLYWQKLDCARHGTHHSFYRPDFQSTVLTKLGAEILFTQKSNESIARDSDIINHADLMLLSLCGPVRRSLLDHSRSTLSQWFH